MPKTTEGTDQEASAVAGVTRRDIKIREARCASDEKHSLRAIQEFDDEFPDKQGRRHGVIFCSDEVEIYCYRTKTQRVAIVQKSAV